MNINDTDTTQSRRSLAASDLFGFLWDFRDRKVNQASYWYGVFEALGIFWVLRWTWEGTGFEWWRVPLVVLSIIAAKWCQSRHALKYDPNDQGDSR
jgi:hypothetical protein